MEFSQILDSLHVFPSSHVKYKLFFWCTMVTLWVYVMYCYIAYRPALPALFYGSVTTRSADMELQRSSLGASRGLLNNNNIDLDSAGEDSEEIGGDAKALEDSAMSRVRNGPMSKKLPQAIIIGVKKAGTRALLEYLRLHPDIKAAGPEPHFFDRNYDKGLEWYRELMPKSAEGQVTIEKTPCYYVTKDIPARIHAMSKDTKLIVIVRDPVTRAISDYAQSLAKRSDLPSFETMTLKNMSTSAINVSNIAIQIGLYAKHLERWLQYFPMKQLLFVRGENLVTEPAGVVAQVEDFLGLRRMVTEKNFYLDPTKGFPCLKRPDGEDNTPHCLGKNKGRTHPYVDPEVVQRLREFYKPFNRDFYELTGQNFGWD